MRIQWIFCAFLLSFAIQTQAKVYRYVQVGQYETSFELSQYKGQSFLSMMKEVMYPALEKESVPRFMGKHIEGIKRGEGVELRLTSDVSTYHVKYEAHWEEDAERSGRSFAGVDTKPWNNKTEYVADASYKHFLSTLEQLLNNKEEAEPFYRALFQIVLNCDPSGVENLSTLGKQVVADFVAVYVAEQYRHLVSGKGKKLGKRHNWDNAHLQVTLLAAFHSGQGKYDKAMFYKGRFLSEVFHQQSKEKCVYQRPWSKIPSSHWKRPMNLTDYWQFNAECDRSGVNITRRDFQKMGREITRFLIKNSQQIDPYKFNKLFHRKWSRNYIETIVNSVVSNSAPRVYNDWENIMEESLSWILESQSMALDINNHLKGSTHEAH